MSLSSENKNILGFYSGLQKRLAIPDYQRGYSWKKNEIGTLIDDIADFCAMHGELDNSKRLDILKNRSYFIGTIVINTESQTPPEDKSYRGSFNDIVDGQQRTITIAILCKHLFDYFDNLKDKNNKYLESIQWQSYEEIKNLLRSVMFGSDSKPRLQLKSYDSAVFYDAFGVKTSLANENEFSDKKNKSNISEGFRIAKIFLASVLENNQKLSGLPLTQLYAEFTWKLLQSAKIVAFKIEGEDGASKESILNIFKVVNSRGLPLSSATTIWNEFCLAIDRSNNPNIPKDAPEKIDAEINEKAEQDRNDFIESCLRGYYYQVKYDKPASNLISTYEDILKGNDRQHFPVDHTLIELSRYMFASITSKDISAYPKECKIFVNILNRIKRDDVLDNVISFLMYTENKKNPIYYWELLRLSLHLNTNDRVTRDQRLREYIKFMRYVRDEAKYPCPNYDHEALIHYLSTADIYKDSTTSHAIVTLAMYATEAENQKFSDYISSTVIENMQIEHIAPQSPKSGKPLNNVHKLGNLLPLDQTRNSANSNNDFRQKCEESYKNAPLSIVNEICDYPRWTDAIIDERSRVIAQRISKFLTDISHAQLKKRVQTNSDNAMKKTVIGQEIKKDDDAVALKDYTQKMTDNQKELLSHFMLDVVLQRCDLDDALIKSKITSKGITRAINDLCKMNLIQEIDSDSYKITNLGQKVKFEFKKANK